MRARFYWLCIRAWHAIFGHPESFRCDAEKHCVCTPDDVCEGCP